MKHLLDRASAMRLVLPLLLIWPLSAVQVRVIPEWKHGVSAPLRDMVFKSLSGEQGDPDDE
jgi:hypothetical protein